MRRSCLGRRNCKVRTALPQQADSAAILKSFSRCLLVCSTLIDILSALVGRAERSPSRWASSPASEPVLRYSEFVINLAD